MFSSILPRLPPYTAEDERRAVARQLLGGQEAAVRFLGKRPGGERDRPSRGADGGEGGADGGSLGSSRIRCLVCGDLTKAKRVFCNYGAISCDNCRCFFRRSAESLLKSRALCPKVGLLFSLLMIEEKYIS